MDLVLDTGADEAVVAAVRSAVARSGLELDAPRAAVSDAWWSAGLAAAVERALPPDAPARLYEAEVARSPRSTRGATRA